MSKCNKYCSVPGCKSMHKKNPELHFHQFPAKGKYKAQIELASGQKAELVDCHKVWVKNLKIGKPVSKYMMVCSRHFEETCYFRINGS